MSIAIERVCRKLDGNLVGAKLECIFNWAHITAQAFLPTYFWATGLNFAAEFALEASKQYIELHFAHSMQVPESAIVLLHAERGVHAGKDIQTLFHMMVIFGAQAFHASLQERLVLIANRGGPLI